MICLFLDTSSNLLKVSLVNNDKLLYDKELTTKNDHSSFLLPCIRDAFQKNNIKYTDLDRIIVGIGPGSFTGTRISITVAKTYAYLNNIPIIPISSLEMMIYGVENYDYYVPLIEDKNNNVFFGIYDSQRKRVYDDSYKNIDDLYEILSNYNGKIALISGNKKYDKYDTFDKKIDSIKISENILINNSEINPHILKPNYIKKIEVESKL